MFNQLSYRQLQWLVAAFAALHNLEEALTIPAYTPAVTRQLSSFVPPNWLAAAADISWIDPALIVVTLVPVLVVGFATTGQTNRYKAWAVIFVQALFFINVFIPHIPSAFLLRGYAPGLLTSVFINLPFSLYFFQRSIQEKHANRANLRWLIGLAIPGLVLALGLLHFIFAQRS